MSSAIAIRYNFRDSRTALTAAITDPRDLIGRQLQPEHKNSIASVLSGRPTQDDCRITASVCKRYGIPYQAEAR